MRNSPGKGLLFPGFLYTRKFSGISWYIPREEPFVLPFRRKDEQAAALEKADYKGFAEKIQRAFAGRDIDALAELVAFPVYVEADEGIIVEDEEQFKKMSGSIFTEELVEIIEKVDVSKLEAAQAGVVMSDEDAALSVVFGSDTKGNMGITEIKSAKE